MDNRIEVKYRSGRNMVKVMMPTKRVKAIMESGEETPSDIAGYKHVDKWYIKNDETPTEAAVEEAPIAEEAPTETAPAKKAAPRKPAKKRTTRKKSG